MLFCDVKVRDKEEELENSLQKIDNLRQDIRKAEKLRRELEVGVTHKAPPAPTLFVIESIKCLI